MLGAVTSFGMYRYYQHYPVSFLDSVNSAIFALGAIRSHPPCLPGFGFDRPRKGSLCLGYDWTLC